VRTLLLLVGLALATASPATAATPLVAKPIVSTVAAQGAEALAADGIANRVYVGTLQGTIEKFDGANRRLVTTIPGGGGAITDVAVDPTIHHVFAIDPSHKELLIVDGTTATLVGRVALDTPPQAVAVDPDLGRVYVAEGDASSTPSLVVFASTPPFSVIKTVALFAGVPKGIALAPDPFKAVLVSISGGSVNPGHVAVVSTQTNSQVDDFGLPQCAPGGIAFDAPLGQLFITRPTCGAVLRLDFTAGSWVATRTNVLPVAADPLAVAVDPRTHRVYVVSAGPSGGSIPGSIATFESAPLSPRPNGLIDSTSLAAGATDLSIDTANDRVFVTNPTTTLRLVPGPRTPGTLTAVSRFDPRIHGFAFVNSFSTALDVTIPLLGTFDLGSFPYGLCGGMTYAALDDFYAGGAAAPGTSPPQSGQLHQYLFNRIIDSLRPHNWDTVQRFIHWMELPINDKNGITGHVTGLHTRTLREFTDKIRPSLDTGHPVPLGIVKASFNVGSSNFGQIWDNHQELAFGYMQVGSEWVLLAYDPNRPGQTAYLWLDRRVETVSLTGGAVDHFRGIFANADNYSPHQPFWVAP
jgi:DNA-binding beta-propeller fold protein YncE